MKKWQVLNNSKKEVEEILLENRGFKLKKQKIEFFKPIHPDELTLKDLNIDKKEIRKAQNRIKQAKEKKEKVIIYGDYDADGITATAILWEALHKFGMDVLPYIPDRFIEGYGINTKSLEKLKKENPELKLIITVDNGIVAHDALSTAKKLGIDVIVTDHHQPDKKKPKALGVIHTIKIAGSAVAWIFAREITGKKSGLELAAIGTIADQMPLIYENRSFAKYGIEELKKTKRIGLVKLLEDAAVKISDIGTYEINYIIAPRINAMGRLKHGIESLRLLCTTDRKRAAELARLVSKTNLERQKIVDEISISVRTKAESFSEGIIFVGDESYHEGVIGLAAGKLTEEFFRPAIVVSIGKDVSKGSARSINGFNIIEAIRAHEDLLIAQGGHAMAAGFTIKTTKLDEFSRKLNKAAKKLLTPELLKRKLKIDCELDFQKINWELVKKVKEFEPSGQGNPSPLFVTYKVLIADAKLLGKDKTHLKLKLEKDSKFFDAIGFGMAKDFPNLKKGDTIDIAYNLEENVWNNVKSLQLRLKDLQYVYAKENGENTGLRKSSKDKRNS